MATPLAPMAPLAAALLRALAQEPPDRDVSLPRLTKRLGQGASVLPRQLSLIRKVRPGCGENSPVG